MIHFFAFCCRLPLFAPAKTNNSQDIIKTIVITVPTKNVADNIISCINIHGDDLVALGIDFLIHKVS